MSFCEATWALILNHQIAHTDFWDGMLMRRRAECILSSQASELPREINELMHRTCSCVKPPQRTGKTVYSDSQLLLAVCPAPTRRAGALSHQVLVRVGRCISAELSSRRDGLRTFAHKRSRMPPSPHLSRAPTLARSFATRSTLQPRSRSRKFVRRAGYTALGLGGIWAADKEFNASAVARSFRTLWTVSVL